LGYNLSVTDIHVPETTLSADIIGVFAGLRRALRRRVGAAGGVSELTDAQRELVRVVRLQPGSRIGDVAQTLHLAPNTVSTLVGTLVGLGWLDRETDPGDARSTRIRLSQTAEDSVAEWRDRRAATLAGFVERLSPEERLRIEHAIPALKTLITSLQENT